MRRIVGRQKDARADISVWEVVQICRVWGVSEADYYRMGSVEGMSLSWFLGCTSTDSRCSSDCSESRGDV